MILVIVGTNYYSFDRLIKEVDLNISNYPTVIQVGVSSYLPQNTDYFKFKDKKSIIDLMKESELVITHGGFGTMMDAINLRKKVIAVPRKIEFNECLDHQEELVKYFESKNYILGCYEIAKLKDLVDKCLKNEITFSKYQPESNIKIKDIVNKKIMKYLKNE